ncbi:MAG: HAD-IA family hydrolase [Mediterranea sp.]|jgi:HAD superfamily hydrolase (TIGR01509 family)|nr:HAD-IA family hydrolase [Mediterranea sp.]
MYKEPINNYLHVHRHTKFDIKAILFDMDGVLFDSMPYHAEAWHQVMCAHRMPLSREEVYLHEGRTGESTIRIVCRREQNREAGREEINSIYEEKTNMFNRFPEARPMPGTRAMLDRIKADGLTPMVVTGSGQHSLLGRLNSSFPDTFRQELIVTAFDVKCGKPNPEPYLMALSKGRLEPNQAIVVENAPLGVEAGVAAGIFTIAVNTGPLDDSVLLDAGAHLLFPSMQALADAWEELYTAFKSFPTIDPITYEI